MSKEECQKFDSLLKAKNKTDFINYRVQKTNEERQEFGKNGRERIHQLYDEEIIIQLYRDRLTDLLAESC